MCGICGFTGAERNNASDQTTLKAMCDIIAHRGPDGEGQYIDDGIALGHRRLSLIDLEGGNQPMVRATGEHASAVTSPALDPDGLPREGEAAASARGDWAIVYNGEIYNYRQLREELEGEGWSFVTNSDTEVLLVGYIAWGEEILQRLRGMFAFAIWNRTTKELFCARDYFGIKPFYYALIDGADENSQAENGISDVPSGSLDALDFDENSRQRMDIRNENSQPKDNIQDESLSGLDTLDSAESLRKCINIHDENSQAEDEASRPFRFVFASETKSILEHPAYERKLNEEALGAYLCFQFSALHETFFKSIYKLPQGHCLRVSADGRLTIKRYWKPSYDFNQTRSQAETVEAIDQAMRESVHFHNVADVEVGSFLSSGIDSSYMAACLAKENPDIKTFTVGFSEYEGEKDEISWAEELAEKLEIANDSKHITEAEYWESLPFVQWHMDEPSADPSAVALYFVDQLAAKKVKAVLSGEGADEFFGGYRIYQAPFSNAKLSWVPKGALHAGSGLLRKLGIRGANYLERASETAEDWYYTNANGVAFSVDERDKVLAPELRERLKTTEVLGGAPQSIGLGVFAEASSQEISAKLQNTSWKTTSKLPLPQTLTAPVYAEVSDLDETTRMQYVDLWFWLVGDILLKTDKMSMAHSLESRVPFLDRKVFELSATIPISQKVNSEQTKIALREAAERAIPKDWAQKEKLGFPVPVASWLREDRYYQMVRDVFTSEIASQFFNTEELVRLLDEHRKETRDNTRRIWIIYMFLMWYDIYFVQQKKPTK